MATIVGVVAVLGQPRREPVELERAVVAVRDRGVADDEPQRAGLRDVAEPLAEQVVVAGRAVDRHRQPRQQLGGERVLGGIAGVGDVAREQHRVRERAQRQDAVDGGGQRAVRDLVVEPDVGIGELGDQSHAPAR